MQVHVPARQDELRHVPVMRLPLLKVRSKLRDVRLFQDESRGGDLRHCHPQSGKSWAPSAERPRGVVKTPTGVGENIRAPVRTPVAWNGVVAGVGGAGGFGWGGSFGVLSDIEDLVRVVVLLEVCLQHVGAFGEKRIRECAGKGIREVRGGFASALYHVLGLELDLALIVHGVLGRRELFGEVDTGSPLGDKSGGEPRAKRSPYLRALVEVLRVLIKSVGLSAELHIENADTGGAAVVHYACADSGPIDKRRAATMLPVLLHNNHGQSFSIDLFEKRLEV